MIKYLGSKRELLGNIVSVVERLPEVRSIADPFSGTARVGHKLKCSGYQVHASDHNAYAATLATCYVQADAEQHIELCYAEWRSDLVLHNLGPHALANHLFAIF